MNANAMNTEDLLNQEVGKLHHILSLQNSPLKEGPQSLQKIGSSSGKAISIEIQRLEWDPSSRTLRIAAYPEVPLTSSSSSASSNDEYVMRARQLLLAPPVQLELFFPESPSDAPLCFGSSDTAALLAERINTFIMPIERSSLMHAVSKIVSTIKQEVDSIWPTTLDYRAEFLRSLSEYLSTSVSSADFFLSLLSMAKSYHPSVRAPVPRYFYRDNSQLVDHAALHAAISCIPPLDTLIDPESPALASLSFQTCVLLHHLLFRERISLEEGKPDQDPELRQLLNRADIKEEEDDPTNKPSAIFKVIHAEDARFSTLAGTHGTDVGFHGSPPENMFSIVSLGLRNLSGTKGMRNGAAFGEGVYLASKLLVAKNFGSWGVKVWRHSRFAAGASLSGGGGVSSSLSSSGGGGGQPLFAYQLIALCEFINLPKYRIGFKKGHNKASSSLSSSTSSATGQTSSSSSSLSISGSGSSKDSSEYYVVDEDQHLVVRAMLLFRDPAIRNTSTMVGGEQTTASQPRAKLGSGGGSGNQRQQRGQQPAVVLLIVVGLVVLALILSTFQKQQASRY